MKHLLAALFILLALPPLYCANAPFSVTYFASFALPNHGSYSLDSTIFENQTEYIILSGGKIIAVMVPTQSAGKYSPAKNSDEIGSIMQSYYYSLGYTPQAAEGLSAAHEKILAIQGRRKAGEQKCRVLIGTDRNSCTDFPSCQVACYSVTSFCEPVALGAGRVFINTIWEFENNSRALDAAYANEDAAYASWSGNRTAQTMASYLSSLDAINRAATQASASPLYDWYSYCFKPDYALADITAVQLSAQKDYMNSSRFISLPDDIGMVMRYTLSGLQNQMDYEISFNKSMEGNPAPSQTAVAANIPSGKSQPSQAQAPPAPPSSPQPAFPPAAGFAAVAIIAGGLAFCLLHRKKRGI